MKPKIIVLTTGGTIGHSSGADGVAVMNFGGDLRGSGAGPLWAIAAPMGWAVGSILSKRLPLPAGPAGGPVGGGFSRLGSDGYDTRCGRRYLHHKPDGDRDSNGAGRPWQCNGDGDRKPIRQPDEMGPVEANDAAGGRHQ